MSGDGQVHLQPKLPPYSADAETQVIGAIILNPSVYYACAAVCSAEDFYREKHQILWRAVERMLKAGKPIDEVALVEQLRDQKTLEAVGGQVGVLEVIAGCTAIRTAHVHAERVRELSQRRQLISFAREVEGHAYTTPADELTGTITSGLTGLLSKATSASKRFSEACVDAEASIKAARSRRAAGGESGAPTGLPSLDRLTGGFSGPRLIIMAARPKCGKSALLNQFGVHAAQRGWPGLIVSLELGADELAIRAMANVGQVSVTKLHRGYDEEMDAALGRVTDIGDIPLWFDTTSTKLDAIIAQIALHKHKYGIRWAAVDHIGLVRTSGRFNSRNDQLGHISWSLKELTKRLDIPIIALSQLSRRSDQDGRRPTPADLRDSGNLEQDADMVIMLHTPVRDRDEPVKAVQIGVPANRIGPSCWLDVKFEFEGRTQTFRETSDPVEGPAAARDPYANLPPPDASHRPYADD